jgi:hypothetical protein
MSVLCLAALGAIHSHIHYSHPENFTVVLFGVGVVILLRYD